MQEVWKDIKGYEGLYQISNYGIIRSLDRLRNNGISGKYIQKGRIMEPFITRGYYQVVLRKDGKYKHHNVHRLVAINFIDNKENKPQVNHINGNKLDNTVENLEWCTQSENQIHAYKKGLQKPIYGKKNRLSKSIKQYNLKGKFIKEYESSMQAEKETGIYHSNITRCCKNFYKTAGGYKWRFSFMEDLDESIINHIPCVE